MKILTSIGTWLRDHAFLALLGAGLIFLFLFVNHFSELFYSAAKLTAVLLVGSLALHFAFPQTFHRYINDSQFLDDFKNLDPKHKVWATVVVLGTIFLISAFCFVHA